MIFLLIGGVANLIVGLLGPSWPNLLIGFGTTGLWVMYLKGWQRR